MSGMSAYVHHRCNCGTVDPMPMCVSCSCLTLWGELGSQQLESSLHPQLKFHAHVVKKMGECHEVDTRTGHPVVARVDSARLRIPCSDAWDSSLHEPFSACE